MLNALDHSVNVIAYKKDNVNYAMCAAWCMNADYDKLLCLLGNQSVTGHNIKKGDIVGFSSLNKNQKDIAEKIGGSHSNEEDKLKGIDVLFYDNAIVINNACSMLKCEVIDVLHLDGIEKDNLLYLRIIDGKNNDGVALHMSDF